MLLQPITVQFSKSTLKPSAYTLTLLANCVYVMSDEHNYILNLIFG